MASIWVYHHQRLMIQNDPRPPLPSPITTRRTVVMFAVFDQDEMTDELLWNGAPGYLLHGDDHPAMMEAIAGIGRDGGSLPIELARQVTVLRRTDPGHSGLSPREKDVLQCLVQGLSYKMIAHQLMISFETVRSHIKRIYEKLQVHNNTEAVAKTIKCGLLG